MEGNNSFSIDCSDSTLGILIIFPFVIIHVVFVAPLSLFILYLGYQRWRQQRSFATTSHSDIFTYHTVVVELIFLFGEVSYFCGKYLGFSELRSLGVYVSCIYLPGQSCFHVLTCIERYMAVAHPVIYLKMRQSKGVRIRNISIGCAWLLFCGFIGVEALYLPDVPYALYSSLLVLSLIIMSFCSVSVLCILIRPGPGEIKGNKDRVDQAKHRAFQTIAAITAVLWLYFVGLVFAVILKMYVLSKNDGCLLLLSANWFMLPSGLVLPLLFLHRVGKLHCCCCHSN